MTARKELSSSVRWIIKNDLAATQKRPSDQYLMAERKLILVRTLKENERKLIVVFFPEICELPEKDPSGVDRQGK